MAVLFVVVALVLSRKAAPAFDWVIDQLKAPGSKLVGSYLLLGASCFVATAIGLEAALSLFATVFFVLVGAGMDLSVINPSDPSSRSALVIAGFMFVVAIIGKVAAGWAVFGPQKTDKLVVGLGMLPRGEVGLIFLGLGTAAKLLSPGLEVAIL